ncbi:MAG: MarR family winged helix-turn-helix transcriptional regulator [Hyphomicrobiaceae bacterium]
MTKPTAKPTRDLTADAATEAILRHWREAVPNDRLAHLVKDAMRGLQRALQIRHARHSVSFGHWTFLRILWETDGLTQRELSERAGVQEPTTFAALKAMETLGYITRRHLPDSRKKVYVFLTEKGRELRPKLVPLAEEVNEIAVKGLTAEDIATTRRTLLVLIENLAHDEADQLRQHRRIPSTRELARLVAEAENGQDEVAKKRSTR